MQYEIKNAPLPVLICKLNSGESVECQKGAMSWMSDTLEMQTGLGNGGGGFLGALGKMAKSAVTGESIFRNTYKASKGDGEVAFASSFPGDIIPFDLNGGKSIVAQKSAYLANTVGINMEIFFQKKIGAGFSEEKASLCRNLQVQVSFSLKFVVAYVNISLRQVSQC